MRSLALAVIALATVPSCESGGVGGTRTDSGTSTDARRAAGTHSLKDYQHFSLSGN